MLARILRRSIRSWVRPLCQLCHLPISSLPTPSSPISESIWCQSCLAYFQPTPRCQRCGITTLHTVAQCGSCLSHPPPWQRLYCVGDYQYPLNLLIHQLKYQGKFWLATDIATLLSRQITCPAPMVVPVPLHSYRRWSRGFNQSSALALPLAKQLQSQCHPTLFRRTRHTLTQQGLDREARKTNLKDAFTLTTKPNTEHVAIVDDVVTTGSTVALLSQLLLDSGVKNVDIYCVCRTPESF